MGFFGNLIGSALGSLGSKFLPIEGVDGGKLGGSIGNLLPFKKGGKVRRKTKAKKPKAKRAKKAKK